MVYRNPMADDQTRNPGEAPEAASGTRKPLAPAAERALAEAAARRKARPAKAAADQPVEVGGRDGPDPVRYGDWEKGGIVSDF
jgi:hypothetical protein